MNPISAQIHIGRGAPGRRISPRFCTDSWYSPAIPIVSGLPEGCSEPEPSATPQARIRRLLFPLDVSHARKPAYWDTL
jgi:hypothetical protein